MVRRSTIQPLSETARLEAFSDGVFAIAITLLILEIAIPKSRQGQLGHDLLELWPSYAAYAVSFFTIGIMWMNHHFIFGMIAKANRPLILLNIALLAVIAFIPFPTAQLAEYLSDWGSANLATAIAFYGGSLLLLTLAFTGMWIFARVRPELVKDPALTRIAARRGFVYCVIAIVAYAVAMVFAYSFPVVSLVLYLLVAVMFVTGRLLPRTRVSLDHAPQPSR